MSIPLNTSAKREVFGVVNLVTMKRLQTGFRNDHIVLWLMVSGVIVIPQIAFGFDQSSNVVDSFSPVYKNTKWCIMMIRDFMLYKVPLELLQIKR